MAINKNKIARFVFTAQCLEQFFMGKSNEVKRTDAPQDMFILNIKKIDKAMYEVHFLSETNKTIPKGSIPPLIDSWSYYH